MNVFPPSLAAEMAFQPWVQPDSQWYLKAACSLSHGAGILVTDLSGFAFVSFVQMEMLLMQLRKSLPGVEIDSAEALRFVQASVYPASRGLQSSSTLDGGHCSLMFTQGSPKAAAGMSVILRSSLALAASEMVIPVVLSIQCEAVQSVVAPSSRELAFPTFLKEAVIAPLLMLVSDLAEVTTMATAARGGEELFSEVSLKAPNQSLVIDHPCVLQLLATRMMTAARDKTCVNEPQKKPEVKGKEEFPKQASTYVETPGEISRRKQLEAEVCFKKKSQKPLAEATSTAIAVAHPKKDPSAATDIKKKFKKALR